MKLLGQLNPNVVEISAKEVEPGFRLAGGSHQPFALGNVHHGGEDVTRVVWEPREGLIYIQGSGAPDFVWTLAPDEPVMIELER